MKKIIVSALLGIIILEIGEKTDNKILMGISCVIFISMFFLLWRNADKL